MAVSGECNAAAQARAGSIARASAPESGCNSTPFLAAFSRIVASRAASASSAATISLPIRLNPTPCEAQ